MAKFILKNIKDVCNHCKKAKPTYLGIHSQIKIRICEKCKDKLSKIYGWDEIKSLTNK